MRVGGEEEALGGVGAEGDGRRDAGVAREARDGRVRAARAPDAHEAVVRARREQRVRAVQRQVRDLARVPAQRPQQPPAPRVPHLHARVIRPAEQPSSCLVKLQTVHCPSMSCNRFQLFVCW